MIAVISGTNRPASYTLKVAHLASGALAGAGEEVSLVDLRELPLELFASSSYASKPPAFAVFQEKILAADGILTVVPEYNGSFPGVLKYFIDMLRFPESLYLKPAGFIGLASGAWGGLRAVEQLEMIFQYRHAHLYGRRVFLPRISDLIDEEGRCADTVLGERLNQMATGFATYCQRLL
jgi:NAD(P)H-dependent FMN reductase